jgi:hypothetical protein
MDERNIRACVGHIRAAAALCEQDGQLAHWATLLGVADALLETVDAPALDRR